MDNNIKERIFELVSEIFGMEKSTLRGEQYFRDDLGADSLEEIEMILKCEEEFNVVLSDSEITKIQTLNDAVNVVIDHIEHPEKNIRAEKKPLKTSYMHEWIELVERANEDLLNRCHSKDFHVGRRFEDTDESRVSIYSDIYKYSCGRQTMLNPRFDFQFTDKDCDSIRDLSSHIRHLQDKMEKARRCASDSYIESNERVDALLSNMFSGILLKELLLKQINHDFCSIETNKVNVIINCLARKILFLRLKYFSYI